ncbi:hypothetical protein SAMN00808754_0477 [Thermanaeromonas toyohensis ToBE]|uniref:DUF2225 domain-containing protein n=1 Tax=Thermanaeromonas toyohensis ToBE TaxID=698762 RepID=A0A1W1VEC6_9FIRM|nr:DUF2225 domain-containing protein [Thermanaeromonas toyohensis]SMB91550.1 hypothetical protein SAMN00808754_0477 [Thermanaeromonas toyohensis ToBE]
MSKIEPLYDKRYQCLFCQEKFTNKKVRLSFIRQVGRDTDFCGYFEGENPYFYDVAVCPYCGYAFTANFGPVKKERREIIAEQYIKKIRYKDYTGRRDLPTAIKVYKLAYLTGTLNQEKSSLLAGLCLRLGWFYRYNHEAEEERRYLRRASELYQEAYAQEDTKTTEEAHLWIYLIGELEGRLGNYVVARQWLSRLLHIHNLEPYLRNLVMERWDYYKEKIAEGDAEKQ